MAILEAEKQTNNKNNDHDNDIETRPLIPGLPDEVAELCLLHLPYPYHSLLRSVSSSWNRAITHPSFLHSKQSLSLSRPYLFIFASHKPTSTIQCQALDPSSASWFGVPCPVSVSVSSSPAFACASLPRRGKLFIIDGIMRTNLVYTTATNQWSPASPIPTAKSFFAAESVNGKIVTVSGSGTEIYDPESDTWRVGAGLGDDLARYEVAAVMGKVYVTEGWRWPFTIGPRGWVYDCDGDTWRAMGKGMREGWTGVGVTVGGRVFVIAEYGDCPVKVYDEESDTWQHVGGDRFPREIMKRPFAVRGLEEEGGETRIYVVSCGLNIAIGSVVVCDGDDDDSIGMKLRWEVVKAPEGFSELSPLNCQVVYA